LLLGLILKAIVAWVGEVELLFVSSSTTAKILSSMGLTTTSASGLPSLMASVIAVRS
jgi:hypothetical protein